MTTCCPWQSPAAARSAPGRSKNGASCRAVRDFLLRGRWFAAPVPCRRWGNSQAPPARFPDAWGRYIRFYWPELRAIRNRAPCHIWDTVRDPSAAPRGTWGRCRRARLLRAWLWARLRAWPERLPRPEQLWLAGFFA